MRFSHALTALFLAGVAFAAGDAHAQSQLGYPVVTFDAVTSFATGYWNGVNAFFVTGVQHGAGAPSSLIFEGGTASPSGAAVWATCEKDLLVAINRPGRFSFGVAYASMTAAPPTTGVSSTATNIEYCVLTQLP